MYLELVQVEEGEEEEENTCISFSFSPRNPLTDNGLYESVLLYMEAGEWKTGFTERNESRKSLFIILEILVNKDINY